MPRRVDWLVRPNHPRPPAVLASHGMPRCDILVAGQRVANQDSIGFVGVERAVCFISEIDGRKFGPAVELHRPEQADFSIQSEATIPVHGNAISAERAETIAYLDSCGSPSMAAAMNSPIAKPWINAIDAYTPGKAKGDDGRVLIKLSANENPLGCSEHATAALVEARSTLARYPDPASNALREALGAHFELEVDQIVCGTGSDELLNLIALGYGGPGDEIIYVRYGFSVYDIAARKCAANVVVAPDKDYGTDVDALLALVNERTRVVFVADPNNPTGTYSGHAEIERLHAGLPSDCVLVLDQAYGEYLEDDGAAAFDLARRHDNVLITRTFSKIYGLAAERIGWAYGQPGLIATLNRIRAPFNVTAQGRRRR